VASLLAPGTALAQDPYTAAKEMFDANVETLASFRMCAETIGLPSLYETYKHVAVNDLTMAGKSRSEAVLLVDSVDKKLQSAQRLIDRDACQVVTTDATKRLEIARARFKVAAGLD